MAKLPIDKNHLKMLLDFLTGTDWSDEEQETRLVEALAAYYLNGTRGDVRKTWLLDMTVKGIRKKLQIVITPEEPLVTDGGGLSDAGGN